MKKTYKISSDDLSSSLTVEIDHDLLTDAGLHEINNFWSSAKQLLRDHDGNVLHAVLDRLFTAIIRIQMSEGFTVDGLIQFFDYSNRDWRGDTEGWPKMDGTEGIKIIETDDLDLSDFSLDFYEVS